MPSPTATSPICVARDCSGPRPSPAARAVCAPFVAPDSATKMRHGSATRPSAPRISGAVHSRFGASVERPDAPKTRAATRTMPTAADQERSTTASVRNAARSARSSANAMGRARVSGDTVSAARALCRNASHQNPAASAMTTSTRSIALLRDVVHKNVATTNASEAMPRARAGPRRQATTRARNDVAKTAVAMTASCVVELPKNVCWNVEAKVRMSANRNRRPMTPKVTSPITAGVYRATRRLPCATSRRAPVRRRRRNRARPRSRRTSDPRPSAR